MACLRHREGTPKWPHDKKPFSSLTSHTLKIYSIKTFRAFFRFIGSFYIYHKWILYIVNMVENVEILPGMNIIVPYPALYLEQVGALLVADLHIGYEQALAEDVGVALPTSQLGEITSNLEKLIDQCNPSTLIINGDLKHVFASSPHQEWYEVQQLIETLLERLHRIILIRGNHDTMLGPLKKFGDSVEITAEHRVDDILLVHGHRETDVSDAKTLVIAHEHPSIVLGDSVGARVKLPAFLKGRLDDVDLIVMPAFSPLAGGTEINLASREDLLSPLLRRADLDHMTAYGIDPEAGLLEFPELYKWRDMSLRL